MFNTRAMYIKKIQICNNILQKSKMSANFKQFLKIKQFFHMHYCIKSTTIYSTNHKHVPL